MARGRRCPFLPLPLSPRAWGAWQHVEEGLVLVLTEGCFQDGINSFFLHSGPRGSPGYVLDGRGSQDFL